MDRHVPALAQDLPIVPSSKTVAAPKGAPAKEKRDPKTGEFMSVDDAHRTMKPGQVKDLGGGRTAIKFKTQNGKLVDKQVRQIAHHLAGKHGVGYRTDRVGQSMIENLNHHTVTGPHNKVVKYNEDLESALKAYRNNDFDRLHEILHGE
jgi:hypothetical protein